MLATDATGAVRNAREALRLSPDNLEARLILGAALRRTGDAEAAAKVLSEVSVQAPGAWGPQFEYGAALTVLGRSRAAIEHLRRAAILNPGSWLAQAALHDQLALEPSAQPEQGGGRPDLSAPRALIEAFFYGEPEAGTRLSAAGFAPNDPLMLKALADLAVAWDLAGVVEPHLEIALAAAPRFAPLRLTYALGLYRQEKLPEAIREIAILRADHPTFAVRHLDAALRTQTGDYDAALALFDGLLAEAPDDMDLVLARGHVLKTLGRQAEALRAYRRRADGPTGAGAAYWAIANLKVVPFADADLQRMRARLADPVVELRERVDLHFALGKALEDSGDFGAAFTHYEAGNGLRRSRQPFDPAAHTAFVNRTIATFTPELLAARAGAGCPEADPIFIVGLPRAGSTVVEQVLASHSQVEGTSELPDVRILAAQAGTAPGLRDSGYPARLATLSTDEFQRLGEAYLDRTRLHRRLGRPIFTDKFPGNFLHVGLIHLMLPHARIIDVRRDPVACGLSAFKQNFAEGQGYSADLTWFASYYRDYERLMAHFDAVLPGRVLKVQYETLVDRPESEIRRLLDHCGLSFESACLRFHETVRPVRTASSEQVRRPLDRNGVEQWRKFEPWLAALQAALATR